MTLSMSVGDTERPWVVQKYGGTSLGKMLEEICGNIIPKSFESDNVAVVCSALSFSSKSTGTTSLLLECISLAERAQEDAVARIHDTLTIIRESHVEMLKEAVRKGDPLASVAPRTVEEIEVEIGKDCVDVEVILSAGLVCNTVQ